MDIQRLRAFRSVVATGSVREAANTLGYSPSSVSQQVTALQRSLGVQLLNRVGRGVEPTEAGKALAVRVDALLGELGDLDHFVQGLSQGESSAITIGYFSSLGTTWLPHIIGPLAAQFPGTRIDLNVSDVFDASVRPRPDVQFLVPPADFATPAGYDRIPLATDHYVVAVPQDHPLAAQEQVPLAALMGQEWIDNDLEDGWCKRVITDACAAAGFQPQYRIHTQDHRTALGLVAVGVGITVLPLLAAEELPAGVVQRPVVQPVPVRSITAFVRRERSQLPITQRVLELARIQAATG
ncbi:LysR family transcriptional regulator [Galactobacter caseinivorans]|uniref:LysR family transcriptional regulator n=1 Tax=Galactobacter caseinivorans TaxID=2676123 RepID=A0A496PJU4_9MICC|nr:LysR family transcriptional regulator [Galactobacter caseinivorans]RKW70773.1 LysR family transcriptional regulator [Galactobacter caseinivorans]